MIVMRCAEIYFYIKRMKNLSELSVKHLIFISIVYSKINQHDFIEIDLLVRFRHFNDFHNFIERRCRIQKVASERVDVWQTWNVHWWVIKNKTKILIKFHSIKNMSRRPREQHRWLQPFVTSVQVIIIRTQTMSNWKNIHPKFKDRGNAKGHSFPFFPI